MPYEILYDSKPLSVIETRMNSNNPNLLIEGISYFDILIFMSYYCIRKFELLKIHYYKLRELYSQPGKIKFYLTVSAADSLNRINMWVFHKLGIKTCWHGDGLGQPISKIWKYYAGASWYNSPSEKWLLSSVINKEYKDRGFGGNGVKTTGYLDSAFVNKMQVKKHLKKNLVLKNDQKVVTYATSVTYNENMRLITEETLFEIFKGINDFIELSQNNEHIFFIIKLHPGFVKYHDFLSGYIKEINNIKVISGI